MISTVMTAPPQRTPPAYEALSIHFVERKIDAKRLSIFPRIPL